MEVEIKSELSKSSQQNMLWSAFLVSTSLDKNKCDIYSTSPYLTQCLILFSTSGCGYLENFRVIDNHDFREVELQDCL